MLIYKQYLYRTVSMVTNVVSVAGDWHSDEEGPREVSVWVTQGQQRSGGTTDVLQLRQLQMTGHVPAQPVSVWLLIVCPSTASVCVVAHCLPQHSQCLCGCLLSASAQPVSVWLLIDSQVLWKQQLKKWMNECIRRMYAGYTLSLISLPRFILKQSCLANCNKHYQSTNVFDFYMYLYVYILYICAQCICL